MIKLPDVLEPVVSTLLSKGCYPVIVGGYIRDAILGMDSKDIDIEVYAVQNLETLEQLLEPFGSVNAVGKSFGVLKMRLDGYEIDFSLPRKESKTAQGHKGFDVQLSGQMDFLSAALRRDFTINAIGYDLNSSLLLDPYNGEKDLKESRLRCVNESTFIEDPLRILRAVQMSARFELICDETLFFLMESMVHKGLLEELPKERIYEEIRKLMIKARRPSIGLQLMRRLGIVNRLPFMGAYTVYPAQQGTTPYKNLWEQTLTAINLMAAAKLGDEKRKLRLMFAVWCAGFAIISEDQDEIVRQTTAFLSTFTSEKSLIDEILALVIHFHEPEKLYASRADDAAVYRLANHVKIGDLIRMYGAHYLALNRHATCEAGEWLLEKAGRLNVIQTPLKPLIQGRDLIAAGLTPSPHFSEMLDEIFEAQIQGEFYNYEEAKIWLLSYLSRR